MPCAHWGLNDNLPSNEFVNHLASICIQKKKSVRKSYWTMSVAKNTGGTLALVRVCHVCVTALRPHCSVLHGS